MKTSAWCVFNVSGVPVLETISRTRSAAILRWLEMMVVKPCDWKFWRNRGARCRRITISLA